LRNESIVTSSFFSRYTTYAQHHHKSSQSHDEQSILQEMRDGSTRQAAAHSGTGRGQKQPSTPCPRCAESARTMGTRRLPLLASS
jgi:hypothetical protein